MNQTLVKKTTVFQRLKNITLGKEKPNLLTRISVIGGFAIWLYLFSWHLLTLLSVILFRNLEYGPKISANYQSVGSKYGYYDTVNKLIIHSSAQIIIYIVVLTGLILIWRQKKLGIIVYLISNLSTLFITLIIMGTAYLKYEVGITEYIMIGATTVYFGLGFLLFYRKKETSQQS